MSKHLYNILVVLAFTLLSGSINAQQAAVPPFVRQLQGNLQSYLDTYLEETVYVQTDKPFYVNGEDIWLTVFVLDAATMEPSGISDVVYVELEDPQGNRVSELKLFLTEGMARGDFRLPQQPGGIYTLVAHTKWMQNFDSDRYFRKEIRVQQVTVPNLLMKPDFEKKAYGPGDEVVGLLTVTDLENNPADRAEITADIHTGGQKRETVYTITGKDGKARIIFHLPDTLSTPDGLLNIRVTYRGLEESVSRSIPIVLDRIRLSFYPEGGHMVTGFESRVAFEALNELGKGADISGVVMDNDDRIVVSFSSFHMGMGAFRICPAAGQQYRARIISPAGNDSVFLLPQARSDAYGLSLVQQTSLSVAWNISAPHPVTAVLTVQVHGVLYHTQPVYLQEGTNTVDIPTRNLPAGIAVFTLFDNTGAGQCERLVFVNPDKRLNITVSPDKKSYRPRETVTLNITTADHMNRRVAAQMAMSVADDRLLSFADDRQDHILSWYLVSSELRGKIYEPSFYLNPAESKSVEAMDYLLLTHGWRRFTWQDVRSPGKIPGIFPEKDRIVAGFITNRRGKPVKSRVILAEKDKKNRMQAITTGDSGQFIFRGVDPLSDLLVMSSYLKQVNIVELPCIHPGRFILAGEQEHTGKYPLPEPGKGNAPRPSSPSGVYADQPRSSSADRRSGSGGGGSQLAEMVVVGYGYSRNSISALYFPDSRPVFLELENLLTGSMVPVQAPTATNNPGVAGITMQGHGNQLVVIDGEPLDARINNNVTLAGPFGLNELQNVSVLTPAEATLEYGMRGSNGAIALKKYQSSDFATSVMYYTPKYHRPRYSGVHIPSASFYRAREYYVPVQGKDDERKDFRTTVYWSGRIISDSTGTARVRFNNNDAVTAFRVTTEGISGGLIGRQDTIYSTVLPLSLEARLPHYMNFRDSLQVPVYVRNISDEDQEVNLTMTLPDELQSTGPTSLSFTVAAKQTSTTYFTVATRQVEGTFPVSISMDGGYKDRILRELTVRSVNFPQQVSLSGNSSTESTSFTIHDIEPGSIQGEARLNIRILDDLFSGVESIISAPYGCFEQVSSSNYPNILALQWLQQNGQDPGLEARLKNYLTDGYNRLAAYEITGGGFEWFGKAPAHTALTAYGLMQFLELEQVYPSLVDDQMLKRTLDFLMAKRKGDGTFIQDAGKFGFSVPIRSVTNAYTMHALALSGITDIETEYRYALDEVLRSKDFYRLALVANAAYVLGRNEDYHKLLDIFETYIRTYKPEKIPVESSVVRSNTARLEAMALWARLLLKSGSHDLVEPCIDYISGKRKNGGFGSTQATALCLKALSEYARHAQMGNKAKRGIFTVSLNGAGKQLEFHELMKENRLNIGRDFFIQNLKPGNNTLKCSFEGSVFPFSVDMSWNTGVPVIHPSCPLRLTVSIQQPQVRINETVRISISLHNTHHKGQPMSIAVIGIPAGLSLQPWQLKELQEKEAFDFYEVINDKLILYYREMGPGEDKRIGLDLKADVPGNYTGSASSAYLYYAPDEKYWIEGTEVIVTK